MIQVKAEYSEMKEYTRSIKQTMVEKNECAEMLREDD